jgi:hypothetical protein
LNGDAAFAILDAADAAGSRAWIERWRSWPDREIQGHPAYAGLFVGEVSERVLCATLSTADGCVLYPFVARDLTALPWNPESSSPAIDLVTPYGYGGPFTWGRDAAALAARFWPEFDRWAAASGVVCEFVRFSLFEDTLLHHPGDKEVKLLNVVRDLAPDLETIWMDFEHKVRKNVNKARRSGIRIEADPEGQRLEQFMRIYRATMDRRGAGEGYYFPIEFFEKLRRDLPDGTCWFHALLGDRVVSTELVLLSASTVYSFLGGTDEAAFELRPNDLLKYEIIRWTKERGYARFVLGGGYEMDDGIFRYKRSFAPRGTLPFRVGRRIHQPEAYRTLVATRTAYESSRGLDWKPRHGYFPEYRA